MKIKQRFSKCATVLAITFTLGQSLLTPVQVMANGIQTTSSTEEVQSNSDIKESEDQEKKETDNLDTSRFTIPEVRKELNLEQENSIDKFLATQPLASSGYTTDGDVINFRQEKSSLFRDTGNSSGKLTKYYSDTAYISIPFITISGEENGTVWCIKPDKPFPINVEYAKKVYNDLGVYNILYYAVENGWDQENENYVDVFVALNAYLGHTYQGIDLNLPVFTSDPNVSYLLQKARDKDAPTGKFDIENKIQTADFDKANKIQKTQWYTPTFDGSNVTYDIPTNELDKEVNVELSDGNVYSGKSGTKTVSANVKFRLTAPANYTIKVKFTVSTNQRKKAALIFEPLNADVQSVVKAGGIKDPLTVPDVEATFFARLGNAKFQKLSEFSNLPLEGVVYNVEEEGKESYEMKTDAKGELNFVDRIHGTTIKVTEISNPLGYVLDPTTYELTIEAAETVSKKLVNELQMGNFKGMKQKTILDVAETKKQGTPVYKKVPLAGAEFNLVAETDIFLPDGKTLYIAKGTIVDTVVTDDKGYFESTKEFLIGEPNKYRLVEVNVPEGYRAPSEEQTVFSIPNGNNTEKLIVFDLGMIDNELQTGELNFFKRDTDGLFGLAGATLTVEMMSGLYAGTYFTFVSKAEGNNFTLPVGDIRIAEIKLPTGYMFDTNTPQTQWVTIEDGKTIVLNWNNKKLQPKVGISTQAHTGDGKTQTFTWGEEATFYDDTNLTHENIPAGTKRAYETKLHANYSDGSTAVVWTSGIKDYTVTDKEMTERVIAEYDYRKDPKADEKTTYYFSEDGYNYDNEKPKKDTEHNPKGNDPKQQLTPIVKETPKTPATPKTPTKGSLPSTGETISKMVVVSGIMISSLVVGFVLQRRRIAE